MYTSDVPQHAEAALSVINRKRQHSRKHDERLRTTSENRSAFSGKPTMKSGKANRPKFCKALQKHIQESLLREMTLEL